MTRNVLIIAFGVSALLMLASPTLAGQKASTVSTPMTVTFRDDCFTWVSASVPCRGSSWDRIGSDSNGTWPFPYENRIDGVAAAMTAGGDFELDTNTSAGRTYRTLFIDFGLPVPADPLPGSPFPMFTYAYVDAYLTTYGGSLHTMISGEPPRAIGLMVNFPGWSLRFGIPPWDAGTSLVQVTCVGPAIPGSPCATWEIEGSPTTVGKLLKVSRKGQTEEFGNFYMPFQFTIQSGPQ